MGSASGFRTKEKIQAAVAPPAIPATNAINNPLFQRIQQTMTEELDTQQKAVLEQRGFENNLTRLSVEARVSHEDHKWLVENLQQPPPPPPAPPPPMRTLIMNAWPRKWTR